jgi:hypothetical protein
VGASVSWQREQYTDIQGNVRVPLPKHLVSANHPRWLELIQYVYTNDPMVIKMNECDGEHWPNDRGLRRSRDELVWGTLQSLGHPPNHNFVMEELSADELEVSGGGWNDFI